MRTSIHAVHGPLWLCGLLWLTSAGCTGASDCGPTATYGPVEAQICESDGLFGSSAWVTYRNTAPEPVKIAEWVVIEGVPAYEPPQSLAPGRRVVVSLGPPPAEPSSLLIPGPELRSRAPEPGPPPHR